MHQEAISKPTYPLGSSWIIVFLLAGTTALCHLIDGKVSQANQAMVYLLVVVLASYMLSLRESVAIAMLSVLAFNFFFVVPRWTFTNENRESLISLFIVLLVALTINHLVAGLRREMKAAQMHARRGSVALSNLSQKILNEINRCC